MVVVDGCRDRGVRWKDGTVSWKYTQHHLVMRCWVWVAQVSRVKWEVGKKHVSRIKRRYMRGSLHAWRCCILALEKL